MRGHFIVLEGGEGAGKSTQCQAVADWLRGRGRTVLQTREPGGTPLAERLRALLKDGQPGDIDAETELLLIFAARVDHLRKTVLPALAAGTDVVCDRFIDASYAYQGGGRGIPRQRIDWLCDWLCRDARPDLVLLLDLAAATGRARADARGRADRFEQENEGFAERVRASYRQRAAAHPESHVVIDAGGDVATVRQRIEAALEAHLPQRTDATGRRS